MDPKKLADQLVGFLTWIVTNPFGFMLWIIGTVAIVAMTCTVLAPLFPAFIRPMGDVNKWVYIAGFLYLMRGAGR